MRAVRSNDTVMVISGSDRGKRGRVIRVLPEENRVLVEGVRFVFEHVRRSKRSPQGGRLQREMPIDASRVMLVCPHCDKPTRTGRKLVVDGDKSSKLRLCRKCKKEIR